MNVLGIDPGLDGALVSWDGEELSILEVPTMHSTGRGREVDWNALYQEWRVQFWYTDHVFLEKIHSRPGEGVSSAFKFGMVYGGLKGIIAALELPLTPVPPNVWKKYYGIQASKKGAVLRASQLFPAYASEFRGPRGGIKDGIAEAALIARYGFEKMGA